MIFDLKSGDTHLLDEVAREGLDCLVDGPLQVEELAERLAARLQIDPDADLTTYVRLLLQRFDDLGLVEGTP